MLKSTTIIIIGILTLFGALNVSSGAESESENSWNQEENLLTNGNFEEGNSKPDFWKKSRPRKDESFESNWDDKTAFKGKRSLYIKITQPANRTIQWSSKPFTVHKGQLQGQFYIKTNISKNGKNQSDGCRGVIHFFDAKEQYKGNKQLALTAKNHDWKKFKFTVKVPKGATKATVVLGALGTRGEFWFDDITMNYKPENSNLVSEVLGNGSITTDIPLIIPQPYLEKFNKNSYPWNFDSATIISDAPNSNAVIELQQFLKKMGLSRISINSVHTKLKEPVFYLSKFNDSKITAKLGNKPPTTIPGKQAYILEVQNKDKHPQIIILGSDQGQYYAVQSLKQWFRNIKDKKAYQTGFIYDKPAIKRRGLVSGSHSIKRLNTMAEHKWNYILPLGLPHNAGWFRGLSEDEKKHHKIFLKECRARFIDPVPSIHPGYHREDENGLVLGKPLNGYYFNQKDLNCIKQNELRSFCFYMSLATLTLHSIDLRSLAVLHQELKYLF